MTLEFQRPVGAVADVSELEYIMALMSSTSDKISVDDIQAFLTSRYGIIALKSEVERSILRSFFKETAVNVKSKEIDLLHIVSLLLIPTLRKSAMLLKEKQHPDNELSFHRIIRPRGDLIELVLATILHDTVQGATLKNPPLLTTDLIQQLLISHGEMELASDSALLKEMLQIAKLKQESSQSAVQFDVATFAKALTSDVKLYQPIWEEDPWTRSIEDIFLTNPRVDRNVSVLPKFRTNMAVIEEYDTDNDETETDEEVEDGRKQAKDTRKPVYQLSDILQRSFQLKSFMMSNLDVTAATYRSRALLVGLMITVVAFAMRIISPEKLFLHSEENAQQDIQYYIDQLGDSIIHWLYLSGAVSLFGMIVVGLGSSGNTFDTQNIALPILGAFASLLGASVLVFLPDTNSIIEDILFTKGYLSIVGLLALALVFLLQIQHALYILFFKTAKMKQSGLLYWLLRPRLCTLETKQAAAYKLNNMVENAVALTVPPINDDDNALSFAGQAMNLFTAEQMQHRRCCSLSETIGRMYNRELFQKEGIWFSSRVLAINFGQILVVFCLILGGWELYQHLESTIQIEGAASLISWFSSTPTDESTEDLIVAIVTLYSGVLATAILPSMDIPEPCWSEDSNIPSLLELASIKCGTNSEQSIEDIPMCDEFLSTNAYLCTLAHTYREYRPDLEDTSRNYYYEYGTNSMTFEMFQKSMGGVSEARANMGLFQATAASAATATTSVTDRLLRVVSSHTTCNMGRDSLESWMILYPIVTGVLVATMTALFSTIVFLPSVASTITKLRTGAIPCLRDSKFYQYHSGADRVTILFGSLIWGSFFSSILLGGVVGFFFLVMVWPHTMPYVIKCACIAAGIGIVVVIKEVVVRIYRYYYGHYHGFYREKPGAVNLINLLLECWNFALSIGFVLLRGIKLFLVSIYYLGRADTNYLAPRVGEIQGSQLIDNYPQIFLKDILSYEAHRHPYIDLLGTMYLMKLRYRNDFGSRAGYAWRLIFIYSLMPWLHKYRSLQRNKTLEEYVRVLIKPKKNKKANTKKIIDAVSEGQTVSNTVLLMDNDLHRRSDLAKSIRSKNSVAGSTKHSRGSKAGSTKYSTRSAKYSASSQKYSKSSAVSKKVKQKKVKSDDDFSTLASHSVSFHAGTGPSVFALENEIKALRRKVKELEAKFV